MGLFLLLGMQPAVRAASDDDVTIRIPVVAKSLGRGLVLISTPSPLHVELKVQGDPDLLASLPSMKLSYALDLADMEPGFHTVPVQAGCATLPPGISLLTIRPETLHFRLDEEIEKQVPVRVVCQGTPAPGHTIAETLAKPNRILLRGPKTILDGIHSIPTHPIDVGNASESFKKEITLDLVNNIRMAPETSPIMAEITVAELVATKILKDIPVQGRHATRAYQISPPTISLEVKGAANTLLLLESQRTALAYIDLSDLPTGVTVRRATIELPVDIVLIHADPKIFTVTIK